MCSRKVSGQVRLNSGKVLSKTQVSFCVIDSQVGNNLQRDQTRSAMSARMTFTSFNGQQVRL